MATTRKAAPAAGKAATPKAATKTAKATPKEATKTAKATPKTMTKTTATAPKAATKTTPRSAAKAATPKAPAGLVAATARPAAAPRKAAAAAAVAAAPKKAAAPKPKPAAKAPAAKPAPARAAAAAAAPTPAPAAAMPAAGPAAGDAAPAFSLQASGGRLVSSASLAGQPYLLYFYPKADTPGCTKQACGIQEALPALGRTGITVIGVSPDPMGPIEKFARKYGLEFPLASDADHKVAEAYGVWVEKSMYGRTYMGMERSSFLVGADGRIVQVWRKVKPEEHAAAVLEAAKELG